MTGSASRPKTIEEMGLRDVTITHTGGARGWPGDVPKVRLSTAKMEALGWRPKMSSDEAVRRAIRETVQLLARGVAK